MKQKSPLRCMDRQKNESAEDFQKRRDGIYEATMDKIEYCAYFLSDGGTLSSEQRDDLKEAADIMAAFEHGKLWYDLAQDMLNHAETKV